MIKTGIAIRVGLILAIISLLSLPRTSPTSSAQSGGVELAVDTANLNQDGLLAIFGDLRFGGDIGLPVGAGDINGDNRADVIFCQMYASAGPGNRQNNGQVNFYISDGRDSGVVDASTNPPNIFHLIGQNSGDLLGTSVATGDVNGDGLRDVALGVFGDDGPGNSRFNAGGVTLVLGSTNFNLRADLATADGNPPPGVITIHGARANSRTGIWVDIGDLDGDGFGDIVMGSDQINREGGFHAGGACVLFGSPSLPSVIDLAGNQPGVRMATILGVDEEDHWGSAFHVGDINGDGLGDLAIAGAIFRDSASYVTPDDQGSGHDARAANFNGTRPGAGEVYVIYGSRNFPAQVDLRNPPPGSTHVIGAQQLDFLGSQIHSADLNGDGRRELIIGALQANAPDNRGRTGAVYIFYGSPQLQGATVDLAVPNNSGLQISSIYGEESLDCGGDSVRSFDINKDGLSDLFIGSPEHTLGPEDVGEMRSDAGDTKFIFGQRAFLPAVIKLWDPPASPRVFRLAGAQGEQQGIDGGDEMSYRLTGGDVDGDGFVDYIANAMHGDGFGNRATNAGEVYVFSGKKLSARLGMLPPSTLPAPVISLARLLSNGQATDQAAAGQSGLQVRIELGQGSVTPDTEVTINGVVVSWRAAGAAIIVDLDENPAIRNSVGALTIRVRRTEPLSEFSNEVTAGRLTGPEITSLGVKRKSGGKVKLTVRGTGFQTSSNVTVLNQNGQAIALKSVSINSSESIVVVIKGSAAPPGTTLRVRVTNLAGIQSNERSISVP
ncbi:MAG TPA: integrin alpha [Blastocatellia bacterium]|nr:integrin alpha [Blastocatellia bacterium]